MPDVTGALALQSVAESIFAAAKAVGEEMKNVEARIEACFAEAQEIKDDLDTNDPDARIEARDALLINMGKAMGLIRQYEQLAEAQNALTETASNMMAAAQDLLQ